MDNYGDISLLNSLKISKKEDVVFLLGAGCSINSGCMPSSKLVFEFKKRIYCLRHGIRIGNNDLIDEIRMKEAIENEFGGVCTDNDYSTYFELCFPDSIDRNQFIKDEFHNKKPSRGYLCFAKYLIENNIRYVLTTNFDLLIEKAIRRLDENYDFVNYSEGEKPRLSSSLEIIKLHGDYNYSAIKNTKSELNSLDSELETRLFSIKTKKIVVMGYSGKDISVMSFLKRYLELNPQTILIWCGVEETCDDEHIKELISQNSGSEYKCITGFDSVFERYYRTFSLPSQIIDEVDANDRFNKCFDLVCTNRPEIFKTNAHKIISPAIVYKTNQDVPGNVLDSLYFSLKNKDYIYFICDNFSLNSLTKNGISFSRCNTCEEDLNLTQKCKLIKELVKFISKIKGIGVFRDNLYIENSEETVKSGIKISIDLVDNTFCLILVPNYFADVEIVSDALKYEINKKKSSLYTRQNWNILEELLKALFANSLHFEYNDLSVSFDNQSEDFDVLKTFYECAEEPLMVGDTMRSVNQLKILDQVGPKKTLFSVDEIKVGVFCLEEDKAKLKSFLDLVENGDYGSGAGVIPKFKGFYNTFKKRITFLYDALPQIRLNMFFGRSVDFVTDGFMRGISKMYKEKNIDIALIYVGNNLSWIRNKDDFDFHNKIKLLSANKYKTQFLEEKTIDSIDNRSKILLNFSIGLYTKTIGMPWYPFKYSKNTLFLGISFGRDSKGITVGCSQMFDGAGRGMQLIISQISEKKDRKNQYLNEDEAYELGKKIRQTYYKTSKTEDLDRIIIHRSDPFKKEEILGFKKAFTGINDFALIQIIEDTTFNAYPFFGDRCGAFPIKRGTIVKTSNDTVYIWTDGSIVDSDVDNGRVYRNSKRGMGRPLKIKKYHGNISANDVANDLMYLTKMDFNSSDVLYSKLPVTIKYSRIVCEIIKQGNFDNDLISFEYVM